MSHVGRLHKDERVAAITTLATRIKLRIRGFATEIEEERAQLADELEGNTPGRAA